MSRTQLAVDSLTASAYVIPTDRPESDGTLAWDSTGLILVTASADGVRGTGWSYGSPAAAGVVRDPLAHAVAGRSAMDVAGSAEVMSRALRNVGREGIGACALSAADIALWDLKARLLDVPLAMLLGQIHGEVAIYGSGGFISYDGQATRDQLEGWVAGDKIPRVKIKIGESWGGNEARDHERVALARDVIGPDTELYVDANGGYSTGQAVRVGQWLAELGVTWFEEPVSSQDPAGLALVRNGVQPDVAAGEYSWTLADSERLLQAGAVDCLQLDVTRCGGVTGFLDAASLGAARSLQVSAHCAPNAHAHVAAAVPNIRHVEYFHDHQRIERMFFDGALDPDGGTLAPDLSQPGMGLEFRSADAEKYRQN